MTDASARGSQIFCRKSGYWIGEARINPSHCSDTNTIGATSPCWNDWANTDEGFLERTLEWRRRACRQHWKVVHRHGSSRIRAEKWISNLNFPANEASCAILHTSQMSWWTASEIAKKLISVVRSVQGVFTKHDATCKLCMMQCGFCIPEDECERESDANAILIVLLTIPAI